MAQVHRESCIHTLILSVCSFPANHGGIVRFRRRNEARRGIRGVKNRVRIRL